MNIFVATTTFGVFSNEPLNLLMDAGITVDLNNKGRKLNYLKFCRIF